MKVAPKKRGRKAAAVVAPNKEEEETEKKAGAKRGKGKLWLLWRKKLGLLMKNLMRRREQRMRQNWLCPSQKFLLHQSKFFKT